MTDQDPVADPLRIAMTSYYLPSESKIGAGYMAHRLANTLVDRGHSITMFSPCRQPSDAAYEHTHVPLNGSLRTFRWARCIRGLELEGFDLLHAHGDNHLRVGLGPPQVRTLHGSCFSEALHIRGVKARLRMAALGITEIGGSVVANRTIAVSANTRTFYPWVRSVIPNGVDLRRFRPGDKEAVATILFVGTYAQRKRGRLLMDAFESVVLPTVPEALLWMVCSDAPSRRNVTVLGRIDDDELADRYRRAWVFCLPSSYEGFGVPYIEAMASGTAVVATRNAGAREVLAGGRFGELTTPDKLGQALLGLLRNEGRRQELELAGLARARRFAWPTVAAEYEAIYETVIAASTGHRSP